jgi:hypothetical protein
MVSVVSTIMIRITLPCFVYPMDVLWTVKIPDVVVVTSPTARQKQPPNTFSTTVPITVAAAAAAVLATTTAPSNPKSQRNQYRDSQPQPPYTRNSHYCP